MSPASKSKSKSKDKSASKAGKEQKATSKPSAPTNSGNGSSAASAYNPISGTFHLLETSAVASSPPLPNNSRFQNITDDSTDERSSSPHGTVSEYDTVSNNGSCSGESEDLKDKVPSSTPQRDPLPGGDSDRREKIRLKNEKKHQRQRERRAQELHERCCGYLMSRKLELLSQQLVNMGFSSERATLALILNEGRVEDSVSWLFEGNEEETRDDDKNADLGSKGNLKIDISEELARVVELEAKFKCSKQEVERAIVACEGDIMKAEESLRVQKEESQATPLKPDPNSEPKNLLRQQEKSTVAVAQRRGDRDFNYSRSGINSAADTEIGLHPLKANQNQSLLISRADKRWPSSIPTQVSTAIAKSEAFHGIGGEKINHHSGLREPVIMMQRPQSGVPRQSMFPASSVNISSPSVSTGFYPNEPSGVEMLRSNMKLLHSQRLGSLARENQACEPFYHSSQYKESPSSEPTGSWSTMGRSPSLAAPPSLGLFSGWRSGGNFGPATPVDWSTGGLMQEFDYNTIDWTLDTSLAASSKSGGLWLGVSSLLRNGSSMRTGPETFRNHRFTGWQDGGIASETASVGPHEWTSPFAGRDIFSLPRQFVTSPSP